jgi:hypothetical protein
MRDRVTDGIPADAGFPFRDLAAVIAAAAPEARHDSLRRGLTASRTGQPGARGWLGPRRPRKQTVIDA